jgi:hypothetical protein
LTLADVLWIARPLKQCNARFRLVTLALWAQRGWRFAVSSNTDKERQVDLDSHKYKVGQSVRYNSSVARRFGSSASFKIVKVLPREDGHRQYRIKSASESHERVAKESELNLEF